MKKKTRYLEKSEVLLTIKNMTRSIQMMDHGDDSGIPELWNLYKMIDKLPSKTEDDFCNLGKWKKVESKDSYAKKTIKLINKGELPPLSNTDEVDFGLQHIK